MADTHKSKPTPNRLLRRARLEQGLTEAALAKEIGVTKGTICRWENGTSKPSPYHFTKLLQALKKQTIQELGLEDEEQEPPQLSEATDTIAEESHPQKLSIWSVPRRNPFFTGREDIFQRLDRTLTKMEAGQPTRPVAITGLGGMGKTQTMIEYAWRHRGDYHVVSWAKAGDADTLRAEFVRIAQELKLPEAASPDQQQAITALKDWMNEQPRWLIVLDNVETPEIVREFLPEEPQGHFVLTSRAQAVGTIARKIDIPCLNQDEGAWFLLRRAQFLALDAPFDTASPFDQQQARAISQELGGLPLALEQAAAYIEETGCGLSSYRERFREQHAELLQRRSSLSDPDYPWTVATTWTLSFARVQQTNPAAAELLCFLAFLNPDGIPLSLVEDAAPYLPRHLRRTARNMVILDGAIGDLRRYSLVQRQEENKIPVIGEALTIHQLVQTVLKDALPEKMRRKWAERTVKAVHQAFSVRAYIPQAQACSVLIEEYELSSKEAANLLYQAGYYAQLRLLNWIAGSLYLQALPIFERLYKLRRMPVVTCLTGIAEVYQARKKFEEAEFYYQRALTIREQLRGSAHPTVDECRAALAGLYAEQGNYELAEAIYRELVEQADPDIADLEGAAVLYVEQERYSEAEALIQRELALLRSVLKPAEPEYLKVTAVLTYLADIYCKQGKMTQAEALLQQELATLQSVLEPTDYQVMVISENLVDISIKQEKRDEAEARLRQLIDLRLQAQEEGVDLARNYLALAEVLVAQGAYEEADVFYQRALTIVDKQEIWERTFLLKLLASYASFFLRTKREKEAAQLMARFESVYQEIEGNNTFWERLTEYMNEGELRRDHLR